MAAGMGASLVQYGSDSDDSGSEQLKAKVPSSLSVMPRSLALKRGSASTSTASAGPSLPPPAKKARIDVGLDPFGLAKAAVDSSSSKGKGKGKDSEQNGTVSPSLQGSGAIDSRPLGPSSGSAPPLEPGSINKQADEEQKDTDKDEEEVEGIPFGWAQDPDGTLYPVTPQAHEQYAQWQAAQHRAQQAEAATGTAADKKKDDNSKLPSYSASELARNGKPSTDASSSSSTLDAKYAAAAASAGGQEDDSSKPAVTKNRATGGRARYKGQLSALLHDANERKDELEEKHSKGRDRQRDARLRYGF
ncbi:unnamed protein product [Tilletia controversa]|uniref:Uncharacterized protein n=3 Tax=Tilletia TaxID=13289 RepID=A0A8X7SV45_9BASI|nr:hypothetical protein CF328_g5419 [Tilletia controversa]KAE8195771.1 hypothetical protein CF335_g5015 [Tilletia laevis]KAE8265018.1 hypothetical protein A4X03_0g535 [Tilletia caries]KAE8196252.1 hypothetical protein CF336_g2715 [Tilletia laevis]KAE8243473.1 hypothetical protein A4X06_0g6292 [Tilletia controversa]